MPSIFDSNAKFNPEVFVKALENIESTNKLDIVAYLKRKTYCGLTRNMNARPHSGAGRRVRPNGRWMETRAKRAARGREFRKCMEKRKPTPKGNRFLGPSGET